MKLYSHILPYLLLLSFYSGNLIDFNKQKTDIINNSPYNGVAVQVLDAYNTEPIPEDRLNAAVARIKKNARKHVWPWVFFNRFIGFQEGSISHSTLSAVPYFKRIRGLDLDNETGALADFYKIWRLSLRLAKELGVPGIVVDPEAYNNYQAYKVSYLAQQLNKSEAEVINRLQAIGADLADIVQQEYPEAILWFLFTGLAPPGSLKGPMDYRSVSYIIKGMLIQAKSSGAKFTIIAGGENSAGYCYRSLTEMIQIYERRRERYQTWLTQFPNLRLGGTIALWDKPENKKGWLQQGACGQSTIRYAADFEPLLRQLLATCDYVWIYAASAAGFNPYDPAIAAAYNQVIQKALTQSRP